MGFYITLNIFFATSGKSHVAASSTQDYDFHRRVAPPPPPPPPPLADDDERSLRRALDSLDEPRRGALPRCALRRLLRALDIDVRPTAHGSVPSAPDADDGTDCDDEDEDEDAEDGTRVHDDDATAATMLDLELEDAVSEDDGAHVTASAHAAATADAFDY